MSPVASRLTTLALWVLLALGGPALFFAVRLVRWNGPRSRGLPASDAVVILGGAIVLVLIVAAAYALRRYGGARERGVAFRKATTTDGPLVLVAAGLTGAVWVFATLDFDMD